MRYQSLIGCVFFLFFLNALFAQDDSDGDVGVDEPMGKTEVVITATRREQEIFESPFSVEVLSLDRIRGSRALPEMFKGSSSVLMQKTGNGQGSPYIRGFTGYQTLMLIDGIRLNNSVFRSGPNQYWSTVDPFSLERLELVRGPGSVLYGSDAIGGTVNAITRTPTFGGTNNIGGRSFTRYATAEGSHIRRLEFDASVPDTIGFFGGVSNKLFGDVRSGAGRQPHTGYDEMNGDMKLVYHLSSEDKLIFAYQRVHQDDVPRTHKTIHAVRFHGTTVGDERKRELTQDRELSYIQYHTEALGGFVDGAKFSMSYHRQEEERDRLKSVGRGGDIQGFEVGTVGLWAQLESDISVGLLTYGVEYYHDRVESYKRTLNEDGSLKSVAIQGSVADDSTYDIFAVYVQDEFKISPEADMTLGLRYNHAAADANEVDIGGVQGSIDDAWDSVVGNVRVLYHLAPTWNVYTGISQGFRAPSLGDLTKLDDTSAVETPSPNLDPEDFLAFELGLKHRSGHWGGQAAYWYTFINNMIVQSPTGVLISGTPEVQKDNIGDGYMHGFDWETSYYGWTDWLVTGNLTWMNGEVDQWDEGAGFIATRAPMSRLMPTTFNLALRYEPERKSYWIEGRATVVAKQNKLALRDMTDTSRIPPGGTPGYMVFDLRGGFDLCQNVSINVALENVTNKNYRVHGSGQNEPGINLVVSAETRF